LPIQVALEETPSSTRETRASASDQEKFEAAVFLEELAARFSRIFRIVATTRLFLREPVWAETLYRATTFKNQL